jgi:tungstate transport system substrate-binding protein
MLVIRKSIHGAFVGWLVSADGQNTIVAYRAGGEQLFFPDAR